MPAHLPFGLRESASQPLQSGAKIFDGCIELSRPLSQTVIGERFRAFDLKDKTTCIVTAILPFNGWLEFVDADVLLDRNRSPFSSFLNIRHARVQRLFTIGLVGETLVAVHADRKANPFSELVDRRRNPILSHSLRLVASLIEPLLVLHNAEIAHGGISPTAFGLAEQSRCIVTDLGLAAFRQELRRETGQFEPIVGIDDYAPPEIIHNEVPNRASDVFSLGCLCYELLSGQHPFRAETVERSNHLTLTTKPKPLAELQDGIPTGLSDAIDQMLRKDPDARPRTVGQVVDLLGEFLPANVSYDSGSGLGSSRNIDRADRRSSSRVASERFSPSGESIGPPADPRFLTALTPKHIVNDETTVLCTQAATFLRYEGFVHALEIYADLMPRVKDAEVWLGAGSCLLGMHRLDELETHLRQALRLYPKRVDLRALRVLLYVEQHAYDDGLLLATQIAEPDERSELPFLARAVAALAMEHSKEADEAFREAVRRRPRAWWLPYQLGQYCSRFNENAFAIEMFKRAYALNRDFYKIPYWLASAYSDAGDHENAKKYLKRCIALEPEFAAAQQALSATKQISSSWKSALGALRKNPLE